MVIENEYVTLEEVQNADSGLSKLKGCLNSSQLSLLQVMSLFLLLPADVWVNIRECSINSNYSFNQDSIYNAAEAGFLDICMEIHATGM